ncbi:MAG: DUF4394 domain-containing protein [Pseudomonadota bacterium]
MKFTWSKIALALGFVASTAAFNVAQAESLVGLSTDNQIGVFDSANLAAAAFVNISGLSSGESLIGIDLRPSNNTIYGISTSNIVYTVDAYSGVATFVAALSTPIINAALGYGFDFNPVADFAGATSLRLVSSAGSNYAINAATGAVTVATSITGGNYSAVAYTGSTPAGAPAGTMLYYVDASDNTLNRNVAPGTFNAPNIQEVGKLNANIGSINGFEIFADGSAFLAATVGDGNGQTQLFDVDLVTGKASQIGQFGRGVIGLAAAPSAVPVPAAAWLFGSALIGFASFRRKSV